MALLSGEVETLSPPGFNCLGIAGFRMALLSGEVETFLEQLEQAKQQQFRMALLSGEVETIPQTTNASLSSNRVPDGFAIRGS